jgi:P4 family phage/plasmid primase-like protien
MMIDDVLNRLKKVKSIGRGRWQCCCPCHNDKQASLTVSLSGDKVLMHCHAGCRTGDILDKIGLKMTDLFADERRESGWKSKIKDLEAVYDYGEYVKLRCKDKKILYGHIEDDKFVKGLPKGTEKTLYRREAVERAKRERQPIYIVEGEKDADTMKKMGFYCTTAGGVNDWKAEFAKLFIGADVVILPDNDQPGLDLAKRIFWDLHHYACRVKTVQTSQQEKGDVTDYIEKEGHVKADLASLVLAAPWALAPWLSDNGRGMKVNADLLADSISKSLDYIALQKKGTDFAEFYIYEDGVYKKCSKIEFKGIIKRYIPLGCASDNTLNNVYNLMLCVKERIYDIDDVDTDEDVINIKNGLYNVKTGVLLPHSKEKLSIFQLDCEFDENAKCPQWQSYLDGLCTKRDKGVDLETKSVLQEWFGLIVSNVNVAQKVKKCLALYSSLGNTGKSVFLSVLRAVLGDGNVINLAMQEMSQRFAIADLYDKRADIVGDQKADDIEDSSVFKQLTGGDAVKVEFKGKQSFDFVFRGAIVISCNNLPFFKDDKGGHIFERFTIVNCENVIPEEKRDGDMLSKLMTERDGIFLWAMEGLQRLIRNGYRFTYSKAISDTVDKYRGNVDTFYKFISENYIITGKRTDMVAKTELEGQYERWCEESDYIAIKKRNIAERAEKSDIVLAKYNGNRAYRGIKIKTVTEVADVEEEELPCEFRVSKQGKLVDIKGVDPLRK